ncbi:hypothetical protein HN358_02595 [Candidatus Uhrbacteria bacterium]|jgi:hypothetical protein|nr:hypothetical protein [Candidatus Uhrbacteria bacterium]MBT7717568.1 hypothetical protein [Candidatus Uhrbacteria bacterium]
MSREIIAQLKELKNHADTGWVNDVAQDDSRDVLMKAIGHNEDRVVLDAQGAYIRWNLVQTAVRPVGVGMLMLMFVFGGWFTSAKAAANSLPGDTLYGVKIATEQVQLFITSDDNKAVLHTQFAQRRLSEVQALQTSDDELADQYLVETVHALEAEMIKAGDALAQMKMGGDAATLTVASILDEKIGSINAELDLVSGQDEVVDAAQDAADQVAESAVDTIVESHEVEETQESATAVDRSFKNEYTSLRSRQEFNLGRVATIRLVVTENALGGIITEDELLHMEFIVEDATDEVGRAMGLAAAGGYRAAFEILREADVTLLGIEAQLVEIESAIMAVMSSDSSTEVPVDEDMPAEVSDNDTDDDSAAEELQSDPVAQEIDATIDPQ